MPISDLPRLAEGKTKVVRANPDDPRTVFLCYKDDITAGDGLKHDVFPGKARLDWAVSRDCFELLSHRGLRTHYLDSPEERVMRVRRLDRKLELEVVTRRVAAGSILQWSDAEEGQRFDPVITQFHYKDDRLHDPMLDDRYVDFLIRAKDAWEYASMRLMNAEAFLVLEAAFARFGLQLVDLKLEYGIIDGELCLIDEISGGSFRLWPYRSERPDLDQDNVLTELAPERRLDKDTYRMGAAADAVLSRFQMIAEVTSRFREVA
jgi:phosphoribosylaminoimidazole-succinocarboxamide synthase